MLQEQVISTRKDVGMVSVADYQAGLESSKAKNAKQNDAELNQWLFDRGDENILLTKMMSRPNQLMSKHNEECFWRPFDYVEDGGARARLIVSAESHTKAT